MLFDLDEVLSINPYANVFIFGNFNIHHKDWLTCSGGADRLDLSAPPRNCDSQTPALLDLFNSSDASICSTMSFPPLGKSDHVVISVSIDF